MEFTQDVEALVHLIARAFAKAKGDVMPHLFADVVVEHAKALAADKPAEVAPVEPAPIPAAPEAAHE
jgi:hypothetical protein